MTEITPTAQPAAVKLRLVYHLKEILEKHGITWYRLSKVSGMSDNTIKALCETQLDRLNVSNVERVVNSLRLMTGENITVADVFTVEMAPSDDALLQVVEGYTPVEPPVKPAPKKRTPKAPAEQPKAKKTTAPKKSQPAATPMTAKEKLSTFASSRPRVGGRFVKNT